MGASAETFESKFAGLIDTCKDYLEQQTRQSSIRIESKEGLLFPFPCFFLLTLGIEFDLHSCQLKQEAII